MDGFEELVKTKTWAALQAAKDAAFKVRAALEQDGLADCGEEFDARIALTALENRLRNHFRSKRKSARLWGDPGSHSDKVYAGQQLLSPNKFICICCLAQAVSRERITHVVGCPAVEEGNYVEKG